jgi:trk system potassium uptake protein TrkA
MFVVIVGCGRLGAFLANQLSRDGHSVVVMDKAPEALEALSAEYSGFRVEADGTELAALRQARMEKADLVIAATREDNVNLMVAQVARSLFGVPRVIARVFDPQREEIYRELGAETICPTTIAAKALLASLASPAGEANGGSRS